MAAASEDLRVWLCKSRIACAVVMSTSCKAGIGSATATNRPPGHLECCPAGHAEVSEAATACVSARVAHRVTVCGHAQMFSPTREVWNGDQSPSPCQRSRTEVRKSRRSRTVTGRKGSAARCDRPWAIQAEHTHQASIAAQQPPRPSCLIGIVDQLTASPDDPATVRDLAPNAPLESNSEADRMPRPRVAGDPGGRPHPRGHHQHLAELLAIGVDRTGARARGRRLAAEDGSGPARPAGGGTLGCGNAQE